MDWKYSPIVTGLLHYITIYGRNVFKYKKPSLCMFLILGAIRGMLYIYQYAETYSSESHWKSSEKGSRLQYIIIAIMHDIYFISIIIGS